MFAYPLRTAALAVAAAVGLSACTTPYGYGGVSVGYGSGYGPYAGYGYDYPGYGYSRLGYGYSPYWGWHDNFYYPGTGYYVYDIYRRPYRWTDSHRRYWTTRRERALRSGSNNVIIRDNWGDFDRSTVRRERIRGSVDRPARLERSSSQPNRVERSKVREERRSAREQRKEQIRAERESRPLGRQGGTSQQD